MTQTTSNNQIITSTWALPGVITVFRQIIGVFVKLCEYNTVEYHLYRSINSLLPAVQSRVGVFPVRFTGCGHRGYALTNPGKHHHALYGISHKHSNII